jgi:hypothetical protein
MAGKGPSPTGFSSSPGRTMGFPSSGVIVKSTLSACTAAKPARSAKKTTFVIVLIVPSYLQVEVNTSLLSLEVQGQYTYLSKTDLHPDVLPLVYPGK